MGKDLAQRRAIPSLDGLRGIAVLLVMVAHLGYMSRWAEALVHHHLALAGKLFEFDAGDLGVSVFFVISGYLITTLLLRQEDAAGRLSLRDFYARRFFRIFPPYYAYLLVVGLLWGWRLVPMLRGALLSAALYVANYYPYRLSLPGTEGWLVGHTWSLSLEEQFYLVWPLCLYWLGRRRAASLGCLLLALSPASRLLTLRLFPGSALFGQVDRMFHTRIDTIMAGCVLALLGVWPRAHAVLLRAVRGVPGKATGAVAVLLLFAVLHASWQSFRALQIFGLGAEALLLAYLVFFAIANAQTWSGRLLNHPALRHIGMISYSLYLWQQLWTGPVQMGGQHHVWTRLLLVFACAEASYFVVEKPSFRARDWYLARRRSSFQSAAML